MSGAAVLKQSHYRFDRNESSSLIQTSLSDVFETKPTDALQVLSSVDVVEIIFVIIISFVFVEIIFVIIISFVFALFYT